MNKETDARKYMEMAIKVMEDSIQEDRDDGKVVPHVGAVLIDGEGNFVEKAYRGEFRDGDHAEYTLIDKKLRDRDLSGHMLFATLEPCAPGARSGTKTCCASRIANARIAEAWIGIEDPDPTVARKGIEHLKSRDVKVHMFDRDLQDKIEKANKEFLKQALERAEEEKEESPPLSELENVQAYSDQGDFSMEAIHFYRDKVGLPSDVSTDEIYRNFSKRGLIKLKQDGNKQVISPTQAGLILFGKTPRDTNPGAVVKAQIYYGDEEPEIRDFDEPLVLIPEELEKWLKKVLRSKIVRQRFEREEIPEFPIEVIREAVINALVHRDYDLRNAKVHLDIDDEKIVVKSPGLPVDPIKLEQLKNFSAPSLSRNPQIMYVFNQMHYVEERGIGMRTLRSMPEKYGLPLPEYRYEDPFLVLTFPRSMESVRKVSGIEALKQLNEEELKGYEWVKSQKEVKSTEYAKHFGFNRKKATRHLSKMRDLDIIGDNGESKQSPNYKYVAN